jgi:hypothetical protein
VQGFTGSPRTVLRWLQAQGLFPRRDALRTFQDDWKQAEAKESHTLSGGEERSSAPVSTQQEGLISSVELEGPLASARQLSYLFVKTPARLEAKDQQLLAFLQQEKEIELAYRMTQQLIHLLKNRQGETAPAWISICSSCGISELEAFALGSDTLGMFYLVECSESTLTPQAMPAAVQMVEPETRHYFLTALQADYADCQIWNVQPVPAAQ